VAQAISRTGNIRGPWEQLPELDYSDAGHSMVFKDFTGQLLMVEHNHMSEGSARGEIFEIAITDDGFVLGDHREDLDGLRGIDTTDYLAPKVYPPASRVVTLAKDQSSVGVDFVAMARDDTDGVVGVSYSKAPGSSFSVGTTRVVVTATDKAGNVGRAWFNVVVKPYVEPTPEPYTVRFDHFRLSPDMTGDGRGEVVGLEAAAGDVYRFGATASGGVGAGSKIAAGLAGQVLAAPGDWDGDGKADLMAVEPDGDLMLYPGSGSGSVGTARRVGNGWTGYRVIPAGDLTGDGKNDLLAVKESTGILYLYAGLGDGGFKHPYPQVGNGWIGFQLHAAGDQNGDGRNDILGIDPVGDLYFYAGNGDGTFKTKVKVGNGWNGFTLGSGADLNGDRLSDIVGRDDSTGDLYFYRGTGKGTFATKAKVATGW
jgi:hypothetical protein